MFALWYGTEHCSVPYVPEFWIRIRIQAFAESDPVSRPRFFYEKVFYKFITKIFLIKNRHTVYVHTVPGTLCVFLKTKELYKEQSGSSGMKFLHYFLFWVDDFGLPGRIRIRLPNWPNPDPDPKHWNPGYVEKIVWQVVDHVYYFFFSICKLTRMRIPKNACGSESETLVITRLPVPDTIR